MNIKNQKSLTVDISLTSIFTAIICIGAWVSFPFGGIPVSLQTLAVFVAASILGTKRSVASVFVYILLGVAGLPVFSGFRSGVSVILGPTGGYLIGFVFAAWLIGFISSKFASKKYITLLAMTVGQAVCYLSGILWYEFVYLEKAVSFKEAFAFCVAPFLIPDIIKIIASIILSESVKKILKKQNI